MSNEKETKRWVGTKRFLMKVFAVITIMVLIFSPYLLVLDFKKYLPFVTTVWIISIAYFLFVKVRKDNEDKKNEDEKNEDEKNNVEK